jgi:hypothetical protein
MSKGGEGNEGGAGDEGRWERKESARPGVHSTCTGALKRCSNSYAITPLYTCALNGSKSSKFRQR